MIVGVDTSALSNKATGTSRYITCLIEQLKTLDDEVRCFSDFNSRDKFSIRKKGLQKFLYRNFHLKKEMNEQKIDYALFPDYFMPANFKKPSAVVIHDVSFISHPRFYSKSFVSFYKYQLKKTLENNPLVLTISKNTRAAINKYLNIKKENIRLLQAYSEFGNESYQKATGDYLLYVGHIEPRKNLYFLIKTFLKWRETSKTDLKLIIAGELWLRTKETKKIINEFSNNPQIEFAGYVDEDKLKELYINAAGFVHTSFAEGFCLPVLESMHYKLPIICSFNTGAEEISKPYSIIVNPSSEKSLLKGFDKMFEVISTDKKIDYKIGYSPFLMRDQLEEIIDTLRSKINNKILTSIPFAWNREEAVEKTLLYSALFNSGIKKEYLHKTIFDVKMNKEELDSILLKLYIQNKIYFKDDTAFLNHTFTFHKHSKAKSNHLKNKRALKIINFIPFISSVSLSGGTAHNGYEDHNDIDLFIITKPNALYIVYALIHILSLLFRVRKELCANYLIDERRIEIKYSRDFYTAHQIISLQTIKNEELLNCFFEKNKWIKNHFPNFSWQYTKIHRPAKNIFLIPFNKTLKLLYRFLYKKQLKENRNKTSLMLEELSIKLHTNDNRQRITEEFYNAWGNYKAGTIIIPETEHLKERVVV